jgi:hypothetical protein
LVIAFTKCRSKPVKEKGGSKRNVVRILQTAMAAARKATKAAMRTLSSVLKPTPALLEDDDEAEALALALAEAATAGVV